MFSWMIKLMTSGVLDKLLAYYTQKNTIDGQVAVETIKAEIETRKLQAQIIQTEQGWWVTAMMRPFLFYPLAVHYIAVVLDSIGHFQWNIAKLPDPMSEWQGTILLSLFLSRPLEKFGRSFVDYLTRSRK